MKMPVCAGCLFAGKGATRLRWLAGPRSRTAAKARIRQTARSANLWDAEAPADLASEQVGDLDVTRDSLDGAGRGVGPQGVGGALALQHATVLPEVT